MSAIRSRDTVPEIILRRELFHLGFRYRICCRELPGKPDLVFKKFNAVVFVNGCFWHHHKNCPRATIPNTHKEYWVPKIQRNVQRDGENLLKLESLGWRVLVVWECALKKKTLLKETVPLAAQWIKDGTFSEEIGCIGGRLVMQTLSAMKKDS